MASALEHFEVLAKNGLEVIPLHQGEKRPVFNNWQKEYDKGKSRWYVEQHPGCNLGIRLGSIMDVEGDSPRANQIILDLIGDYPHPSYASRKSIHHLFLNPFPKLTRVVFQDIEFRGRYHQSVLPPSLVETTRYKWLTVDFPVPPPPERLLQFFQKIQNRKKGDVKPGHMKLPCIECRKVCYIHKARFDLEIEAFRTLGMRWTCHDCRSVDIRPLCRKFKSLAHSNK